MINQILDNDFKLSPIFQKRLGESVNDSEYNKSDLPRLIGISKDIFIRAANVGLLPSTKTLIKIVDYFSVSMDYLIGLPIRISAFK